MKKTKFIIFAVAFLGVTSTSKANLTDILQKYCVPKDGSSCVAGVRANYNQSRGTCDCDTNLQYYDSSNRACKNCITGSYANYNFKTCEPIKCPSGYEPVLVTNGNCPSGYSLQQVTNGGCPGGYALQAYNVPTKTWN